MTEDERKEAADRIVARSLSKMGSEIAELKTVNAELLEALEEAPQSVGTPDEFLREYANWFHKVRVAVIAKARVAIAKSDWG